jgi:hypothetical protein
MPPRNGRNRRRRPIDEVLGGGLPTSPATTTTPVDEVLSDGGGETTTTEENPWVNPFMEVYEATEAGALRRLDKRQMEMSKKFAHRGGYFGGKHAIAQGEMEAETGAYLDQLLAQTSLGASERQYQDWQRARGETMNLMNLLPLLLGTESFENIVQMPGQDAGSMLGSLLGMGAGAFTGGLGSGLGTSMGTK